MCPDFTLIVPKWLDLKIFHYIVIIAFMCVHIGGQQYYSERGFEGGGY